MSVDIVNAVNWRTSMREVWQNIWVGDEKDCSPRDNWYTVHACKFPCYVASLGGEVAGKGHPKYLYTEDEDNLYLNIIDPPVPLFKLETFKIFLDRVYTQWKLEKNILIHCNLGQSRSASLAMVFLAKRVEIFDLGGFDHVVGAYAHLDSLYAPNTGITTFLRQNWEIIE